MSSGKNWETRPPADRYTLREANDCFCRETENDPRRKIVDTGRKEGRTKSMVNRWVHLAEDRVYERTGTDTAHSTWLDPEPEKGVGGKLAESR